MLRVGNTNKNNSSICSLCIEETLRQERHHEGEVLQVHLHAKKTGPPG